MRKTLRVFLLPLAMLCAGEPVFAAAVTALGEYYDANTLSGTAEEVDLLKPYPVIVVINDSATIAIHVRGDGGVATTSSPKVNPGERYELPRPTNDGFKGRQIISLIAASGTPVCRIYGLP